MDVPAPRTGAGPPAALATAWTLFLLLASAVVLVASALGPLPAIAVLVAILAVGWCALRGPPAAAAPLVLLGLLGAAVAAAALSAPTSSVPRRPLPRPAALAPPPPATPHASPPAATPRESPPPARASSPRAFVRAYYRALDRHRFALAWRRLTPSVRTGFGGFAAWRAGYATTVSSRPGPISITSRAPGAVHLRHPLDAVDRAPCRRSRFIVDWSLVRTAHGWRAQSARAFAVATAEC